MRYEDIAAELGYTSRARAAEAVLQGLRDTVAEPSTELRALEIERLDALWRRAWQILDRPHLVAQMGRVVKYRGKPVIDDAPVLQAIDRLLRIQERRAKLLGLDAPVEVEVSDGDIDLASELQAYLAGHAAAAGGLPPVAEPEPGPAEDPAR
jgi:hypothetical protein